MELEFIELEFHLKHHYRALEHNYRYGGIKKKKNLHGTRVPFKMPL